MQSIYDIVVVGAGPAGLAFCAATHGKSILLVEAGLPLEVRCSSVPSEVGTGVAGAGIFIDGKLSPFPAGTALWRGAYGLLKDGYAELRQLLQEYSAEIPEMPTEQEIFEYFFKPEATWKLKEYKSFYMDTEKRFAFLYKLIGLAKKNARLECETRVVDIGQSQAGFVIVMKEACGDLQTVKAHQVVLAGGRFMPLQSLLKHIDVPSKEIFRRHEFGIRIQVPRDNAAVLRMAQTHCLDPKFVLEPIPTVQYRTFCFCKRGMVCESNIDGLVTFSGRADVEPTEFTNFGLMARTKDPAAFSQEDIKQFLDTPFQMGIVKTALLADIRWQIEGSLMRVCGPRIGAFLWSALKELFNLFPELCCPELCLFGPCLEGVGVYPNTNAMLQVEGVPELYAIGDTSGTFRGLVPSLLSGYYLAHALRLRARAPVLVTSNKEKVREICAAIGPLATRNLADVPVETLDAVQHAQNKAKLAWMALKDNMKMRRQPYLLVEVSSLEIDVLKGYPGVHVRSFFEHLGVERIQQLTLGSGATFKSVLAVVEPNTGNVKTFVGSCRGTIVEASGKHGFDWDCLFRPDGYDVTYGDMDRVVKTKISARFHAAQLLREYLN